MSLEKIILAIKKYDNFLITAHTSLEADALGAELAFYSILKKMGKQGQIINQDILPCGCEFLPGKEKIRRLGRNARRVKFDCLVVLDCADLKRTGRVYKLNKEDKPVLNIDHHISNCRFGNVYWVDAGASSCSEMIYRLHKKLKLKMDRDTALALYAGMVADTGSFRYSNTSSFTHRAVAELMRFGVNPAQVYNSIYENLSPAAARLLVRLLEKMEFDESGKIAWFKIRSRVLRNKNICVDLPEQLLSFARAIKGVEVVALFKENLGPKNQVRINLRSQGRVDVNRIALSFGGGGHKNAAGCTVNGKIDKVARVCLAKIRSSLQ